MAAVSGGGRLALGSESAGPPAAPDDEPGFPASAGNPLEGPPDAGVTRVILVDDHRTLSEALAVAIDRHPDLACVGTPATIAECLAMDEMTAPDVALLDIYLPDGDGIEAIPAIRARWPAVRIVVMTGYTDIDVMTRAASAGASGFMPKESPVRAVLAAIRAARDGQMLVDGSTLAAILGRAGRVAPGTPAGDDPGSHMTAREQDVLDLMAQGLDSHAVAARLGISLHTCRGYQKSILAKLNAHSQLEAVVVASRRGLTARLGR